MLNTEGALKALFYEVPECPPQATLGRLCNCLLDLACDTRDASEGQGGDGVGVRRKGFRSVLASLVKLAAEVPRQKPSSKFPEFCCEVAHDWSLPMGWGFAEGLRSVLAGKLG